MTIIANKMSLFLFPLRNRLLLPSTILVKADSLLSLLTGAFGVFIAAEESVPQRVNLILRLPGRLL